ncbi:hypothetical protein BDR03DRAFT_1016090, partial [Suillus americanus]
MPVVRQRARRSARLRANAHPRARAMDHPPSTSQAHPTPASDSGPRLTVQWGKEDALTDILVDHITSHPADSRILFYSEGKNMIPETDDQPSGKDKSDIYGVLARLIFANHLKYGNAYRQNPKKFCDSVANHIVSLKNRYKKLKTSLTSTGAGVLPGDGYANLLAKINSEWKWFSDLDAIWHSNPAFAAPTHSSRPGVDHAGQMFSLTQVPRSRASASSKRLEGATQPQPQPPSSSEDAPLPPPRNDPPIDPRLLQPAPQPPPRNDPPIDPRLLQPASSLAPAS